MARLMWASDELHAKLINVISKNDRSRPPRKVSRVCGDVYDALSPAEPRGGRRARPCVCASPPAHDTRVVYMELCGRGRRGGAGPGGAAPEARRRAPEGGRVLPLSGPIYARGFEPSSARLGRHISHAPTHPHTHTLAVAVQTARADAPRLKSSEATPPPPPVPSPPYPSISRYLHRAFPASKRRGDVAVGGEGRDQDVADPEGNEESGAGKGEWSVAAQLGGSAEQDQGDCDDGEDGEDEHL